MPGREAREHVALILVLVDTAREQQPAVALDDPRVVAGREAGRADAAREREQLGEAKAAVAADARVRRLTACIAAHERRDDRAAERVAQIERDVRKTARMARLAGGEHRARRAARTLGVRPVRVEPEPQRHTDRRRPRLEQRHGAVDAAAHRNRDAGGIRGARGPRVRARSPVRRPAASRRRRRRPRAGSGRAGRCRCPERPRRGSGRPGRAAGRRPSRCRVPNRRTAPASGQGTGGESWGEPRLPPPCSDPADRAAST